VKGRRGEGVKGRRGEGEKGRKGEGVKGSEGGMKGYKTYNPVHRHSGTPMPLKIES
jgi:hypothetical protein